MEKQSKILVVVLLASLFIGTTFVKTKFAVPIGQVNIYDVIESEWDYTFDSWDISYESLGEGFEFNDQLYSLDEQVTVNVTGADALAVEYTVNVGTESENHYSSGLSIICIYFLLAYPFFVGGGLEYEFYTGDVELGLGLQGLYFIEPTVAYDAFTQLADNNYIATEYVDDESWTYDIVNGIFDADDNIAVFNWQFNARYTVWTDETDFSGEYSFTIEYDQTSGELHRYRMAVDYSGILGHDSVSIESLQEIELHGQNGTPGFSWFITISAIAVIGLISVVIKKREKR